MVLPRRLRHAPRGDLRRPEDRAAVPVGTRVDGTSPGSTADVSGDGVRGALAGAIPRGAGPVSRDHFHIRTPAQPGGQGSSPAALISTATRSTTSGTTLSGYMNQTMTRLFHDGTDNLTYGTYLSTWFCTRS